MKRWRTMHRRKRTECKRLERLYWKILIEQAREMVKRDEGLEDG